MTEIGPLMRWLSVTYWARFGVWPESLTLSLGGRPIPADLVREAEAERRLEEVRERDAQAR